MRAFWFTVGAFVGYFVGIRQFPAEILYLCAIPVAISWARSEEKEREKEAIEAGKHSFYYGYKFKD